MKQGPSATHVEPLSVFTDDRGQVFNPIDAPAFSDQKNFHVVTSRPQAIRGNHYHPKGTEILIIAGPALVRVREKNGIRDIDIPDRAVYRLTIPPGISHAVKHTGSDDGFLLSFNSIPYNPENPDMVEDVLL